jgi:serine/threonine protein kinase
MVHRDLKPENIFINTRNGKIRTIIGDFGHIKELSINMTECRGSPKYVDPFLFGNSKNYSFDWDIYSFGLIMLEVFTGKFLIDIERSEFVSIKKFH